jgi:DNA-binding HxlR family transcriptional regulator
MRALPNATAPAGELLALIDAAWTTQVVHAACVHRLPERLAGSAADAASLSAATGCDADALARLLRAMAAIGLCERQPDAPAGGAARWQLTPVGECLREDHPCSLRHWALHAGGPLWQRQGELAEAVRTGQNWAQRRGYGAHAYAQLRHDGAASAVFHRAMVELTRLAIPQILPLLELGDTRVVVDVGGGRGELLSAVLHERPHARGVLFDQPGALDGAHAALEAAGLAARCRVEGGDFFAALPAGGDLYLLKSVLHNWDDRLCIALLQACAAAMPRGARLLVIERALPATPGTGVQHRSSARTDLNMLASMTGRERSPQQYAALLEAAGLAAPGARGSGAEPGAEPEAAWVVVEARRT